jgi:hypothetical protein
MTHPFLLVLIWFVFGPALLIHKLFWFIRYAVYCFQGRQDSTYVVRNAIYLVVNAIITFMPLFFRWID